MIKKVLVTGGAGYIGSHVVKLLGKNGYDVVVLDNLSTGRRESVLYGKLVVGDLADRGLVDELFKTHQFDAVMHFAGSIIVPESVSNPLMYYGNNSANTLQLLQACEKYRVHRFIFSSTAATYGEADGEEIDENTPQLPMSPYGTSKLMTEMMLKDLRVARPEFSFVALRYFNVSGADPEGEIGQCFPGATHLIKVSCEAALGKRPKVCIFGTDYNTPDGTGIRDYIHVMDLAQAHIDALKYLEKEPQGHFLNCGYGRGSSVKEVIDIVKKVSGVDFCVEETPRRPGDVAKVISKADKIKKVLGWAPQYDNLELIVKTAYEWEKKLGQPNHC